MIEVEAGVNALRTLEKVIEVQEHEEKDKPVKTN